MYDCHSQPWTPDMMLVEPKVFSKFSKTVDESLVSFTWTDGILSIGYTASRRLLLVIFLTKIHYKEIRVCVKIFQKINQKVSVNGKERLLITVDVIKQIHFLQKSEPKQLFKTLSFNLVNKYLI